MNPTKDRAWVLKWKDGRYYAQIGFHTKKLHEAEQYDTKHDANEARKPVQNCAAYSGQKLKATKIFLVEA